MRRGSALCVALVLGWIVSAGARGAEDQPAPAAADPATAEASAKYRLAFRFAPNQIVRYEVTTETEMTTHYSEVTEIARNKSSTRRSYRVTDVAETGAGVLELAIDWVRMVVEFDDGVARTKPIEFQSDDDRKHPEKFAHILDTVGRPTARITVSPQGKPLKVEALVTRPLDPAAARQKGAATAAPQTDVSLESYLIPLPEEPVAVGDVWKERLEIAARNDQKLPVRITLQRYYKLAEVNDGLAKIEFRTAILTPVQEPGIAAQLIQRETAGTIVFDLNEGVIVSRDVDVDRSVVNPFGAKSSMRAVSRYRERLLREPVAAREPATTAKQ